MLRVKREVMDTLISKDLIKSYLPDENEVDAAERRYDFFPCGVRFDDIQQRDRYLSEDYEFCRLAASAGYKIHVDPNCVARHFGEIAFPTEIPGQNEQPDTAP